MDDRWDSKLATGHDALRVVGEGKVADMATVVPEYMAKDLPLHQIFKCFPLGPTGQKQVAFFRRAYADIAQSPAELEKNNAVPLLLATGYPVAFFSIKPLNSLNDLEGKQMAFNQLLALRLSAQRGSHAGHDALGRRRLQRLAGQNPGWADGQHRQRLYVECP